MRKVFLSVLNDEYENILHSDLPEKEKNRKYAELMTEMEHNFKIPMLRDFEWERENRAVIALYRKISLSRNFEEE